MNTVPEIRREKVFIPPEMPAQEIKEKYGLSSKRAREVLKQGFFVKNYSKKQIIIDPENFDPAVSYSTAKRVYWKNFRWSPLVQSIKEDLIQEAVTRMYELSGKVKENANEKYGIGYGYFWVAHNAMLSFIKKWQRAMRFRVFGDVEDELMASKIYASKKELIL
ncbi:MAG TPA: hypothetical protein VK568_10575 [Thermodesulfobacteriota bacterium]|jgi:hypothetical protein|nr:hypothetical protein [Thermodesulfobacteriota bacterium]